MNDNIDTVTWDIIKPNIKTPGQPYYLRVWLTYTPFTLEKKNKKQKNFWLLSSLEIVMSLAKSKKHDTSIQTINLLAVEPKLVEQHK